MLYSELCNSNNIFVLPSLHQTYLFVTKFNSSPPNKIRKGLTKFLLELSIIFFLFLSSIFGSFFYEVALTDTVFGGQKLHLFAILQSLNMIAGQEFNVWKYGENSRDFLHYVRLLRFISNSLRRAGWCLRTNSLSLKIDIAIPFIFIGNQNTSIYNFFFLAVLCLILIYFNHLIAMYVPV